MSLNDSKVINTLLHKRKYLPLPPHESASELVEEFSDHSAGKIEKIRKDIIQFHGNIKDTDDEVKMDITEMSFLTSATEEEIKSMLLKSPTIPIIKPHLKNIILELIIKNYRPVSNLSCLSKTVERELWLKG